MMIGNNIQHDVSLDKFERVKLISDKRKDLDEITAQIQSDILQCFKRLEDGLKTRERRLMRQVEAIHRQQLSLIQSDLDVLPSLPMLTVNLNSAEEIEQQILNFGNIELKGNNIAVNNSEPFKVVEYQEAHKDHINFYKSLPNEDIEAQKKRDLCLKTPLKLNLAPLRQKTSDLDSTIILSESFASNLEDNDSSNLFDDEHCILKSLQALSPKYDLQGVSVNNKHPKQIQQWLKQILVETETEPAVQDQDHFCVIAKSQLPLET